MFQCLKCVHDHSILLDDLNSTESRKNLAELFYNYFTNNIYKII